MTEKDGHYEKTVSNLTNGEVKIQRRVYNILLLQKETSSIYFTLEDREGLKKDKKRSLLFNLHNIWYIRKQI